MRYSTAAIATTALTAAFLWSVTAAFASLQTESQRAAAPALNADAGSPVAPFLGRWSGTLNINAPGGNSAKFPMALEIEATTDPDTHVWRIIYGDDPRQDIRDYRLITRDAEAGEYAIDEQNSIVIATYLAGDAFHASFAMDSSVITLSYTLIEDDTIRFDLTSWDTAAPESTGGQDNIPEVRAPKLTASQTALLTREVAQDEQQPQPSQPQPSQSGEGQPDE
jgi:hypothetical protein